MSRELGLVGLGVGGVMLSSVESVLGEARKLRLMAAFAGSRNTRSLDSHMPKAAGMRYVGRLTDYSATMMIVVSARALQPR